MGTTYFVANSSKRQYFDPSYVGAGENTKWSGILRGFSGYVLAQLLMPGRQFEFHLQSWIGDSLFLVGDDSGPSSIDQLRPFQHKPDEHAYHIVTERFDDITINLIAEMARDRDTLALYVQAAERYPDMMIRLAHAVLHLYATHIEIALCERFGEDWERHYHEALKTLPGHSPMPMVPRSSEELR